MNKEELFEMVAINGGAIVSSASLTPEAIMNAKRFKVFYVDEKGCGYAWIPKEYALTWAVNDNQTT